MGMVKTKVPVKPKSKSPVAKPKASAGRRPTAVEKTEALELGIVPLKDLVVFPRMILPLFVGRQQSVEAIEAALLHDSKLVVMAQKNQKLAYPAQKDLPRYGTLVQLLQTLRLPDGSIKLMVECRSRVHLQKYLQSAPFFKGAFEICADPAPHALSAEEEILVKLVLKQFEQFIQLSHNLFPEAMEQVPEIDDPGTLADMVASYVQASVKEKQVILEILDPLKRLEAVGRLLSKSLELLQIENQIHSKIKQSIDKNQKEYFLREKMRFIREELGDESDSEIATYQAKVDKLPVEEVREKAKKELQRLEKMPAISAESAVIRNYLDLILDLPWEKPETKPISLKSAQKILDKEHFGLTKVKDRILEYLAVRQLATKPQNTLLCLLGPPGVGKTSLCRSIAHATGRKFERVALGGVGDDAEIRGHRRTYVGALPGRIIQAIRRAGTTNVLILLDEVDKLTKHFHGDPASALLEVLDPEQNNAFRDHYLELPMDLSNVLFLCAGNLGETMPKPLLDRMEILQLSGYTQEEKIEIAKGYLVARQAEQTGLQSQKIIFTSAMLRQIIRRYTREAGVREFERKIGRILRKLARRYLQEGTVPAKIHTVAQLTDLLGPQTYHDPELEEENQIGLVRGLAWTETGGSILPIEVALSPGKGKLITTGRLGDVMKESMQIALGYVRQMKLDKQSLQKKDIHIHVPEGAIPKDGPSAGIAITTALVSALTGKPVSGKIAMTGEVTLRGKVLAIGGIKEKSLAAYREGIQTIIIPYDNQSDLEEIPAEIRKKIQFIAVKDVSKVLEISIMD